ncbi:MAG: hypothetical protein QOD26_15, partial [Betaproteobacteria bacterium]|nr:hypothetical protein [Betaproteobacteria bacterium]
GADFIALRRDVELIASDAKALARDLAEAAQQREALA